MLTWSTVSLSNLSMIFSKNLFFYSIETVITVKGNQIIRRQMKTVPDAKRR